MGFWIPDHSSPTWFLGVFLGLMGLKTASRKKGGAGQQVKFYSLTVESMAFAAQVLEYRHEQRLKREEENRLHQMMMDTQYGIRNDFISTPTENKNISNKQGEVNMAQSQLNKVLDRIKPGINLLETVAQGLKIFKGLIDGVNYPNWIRRLLIDWLKQPMKLIITQ